MAMPRTRRRAVDRPAPASVTSTTSISSWPQFTGTVTSPFIPARAAARSTASARLFCLRDRGEITVVHLAEPVVHTLSAGPVEALAEDGIPEDLRPVRRPRIVGIRDGGAATLGRE
ncbi:MAG: hypothetical protein E6I03_05455 [Chloroflexi bacterium]|nr:MAG: hypothetical protein E6I03_05455 [Chloroflexota bacterium]